MARYANGSPFGGAGERSETERASPFPKSICTAISTGFCQSDAIAVLFYFSVASFPSQSPSVTALPKGEPLACRSGFVWTHKVQFIRNTSAPLQRAAAAEHAFPVKLLLLLVAGHYFLCNIRLPAVRRKWPGLPRAPPLGQRRRPPPVAETGRHCWGSGQQDASKALRMLGAATRAVSRPRRD